jgi:hypothetical protein
MQTTQRYSYYTMIAKSHNTFLPLTLDKFERDLCQRPTLGFSVPSPRNSAAVSQE